MVVGAGHVEALRSADAVDGLDSSAAVSALVEDLNSSLNVTHGRHS